MDTTTFIPSDSMKLTSHLIVFSVGDETDTAQKQLLSSAEEYRCVNLRNSKPTEHTINWQISQSVFHRPCRTINKQFLAVGLIKDNYGCVYFVRF
jgi:hypothetical protein